MVKSAGGALGDECLNFIAFERQSVRGEGHFETKHGSERQQKKDWRPNFSLLCFLLCPLRPQLFWSSFIKILVSVLSQNNDADAIAVITLSHITVSYYISDVFYEKSCWCCWKTAFVFKDKNSVFSFPNSLANYSRNDKNNSVRKPLSREDAIWRGKSSSPDTWNGSSGRPYSVIQWDHYPNPLNRQTLLKILSMDVER